MKTRYLGEILYKLEYLRREQIAEILAEQEQLRADKIIKLFGELCIEKGYLNIEQLNHALKESLLDVIRDSATKSFIKDTAQLALNQLELTEQPTNDETYLSEEGKLALKVHQEELETQLEEAKRKLVQLQSSRSTQFTEITAQHCKNQIIEIKHKLKHIHHDLHVFTRQSE